MSLFEKENPNCLEYPLLLYTQTQRLQASIRVQSEHAVKVLGSDVNVAIAVAVHLHRLACTGAIHQVAGDDVAVLARGQAGLQSLREVVEVVVEGDEALGAATEGNLVVAIVPPVVQLGAADGVLEADHVVDLAPAMLTDPAIDAGAVLIELRRDDALLGVLGRRLVAIVEAKGAHHLADAIGIGQMEGGGHFVLPGRLVVQLLAAVALIVVVVHEGERLLRGQESPVGAPARQPFQRIVAAECLADFL